MVMASAIVNIATCGFSAGTPTVQRHKMSSPMSPISLPCLWLWRYNCLNCTTKKKKKKITSEDYERQFADVLHKSTTKCTKGNMQTNVNKHISTAKHTRKWGNKKTVQNNNSDRGWWIHMDSKYSKNQWHQELFQSWEALEGLVTFRFDFGTTSRVSLEDLRLRSGS